MNFLKRLGRMRPPVETYPLLGAIGVSFLLIRFFGSKAIGRPEVVINKKRPFPRVNQKNSERK